MVLPLALPGTGVINSPQIKSRQVQGVGSQYLTSTGFSKLFRRIQICRREGRYGSGRRLNLRNCLPHLGQSLMMILSESIWLLLHDSHASPTIKSEKPSTKFRASISTPLKATNPPMPLYPASPERPKGLVSPSLNPPGY